MPPAEKKRTDDRKKLGDAEEVAVRVTEMEEELAHLKASFEQYFLGVERKPPNDKHDAFKKHLRDLKGTFVRATGVKFKVQALGAKYLTYERLWARTLQEIEAGTYRRDLFKIKRKAEAAPKKKTAAAAPNPDATPPEPDPLGAHPEDAPVPLGAEPEFAPMPPTPVPGTPQPGAPAPRPAAVAAKPAPAGPPGKPLITAAQAQSPVPIRQSPRPATAPVAAEGGLSENKIKAIYDAYVMAKKRCNEDVSKISVDTLAVTLRKQVPELMKQHGAKSVEFKVVIKDGKAILRALPKT